MNVCVADKGQRSKEERKKASRRNDCADMARSMLVPTQSGIARVFAQAVKWCAPEKREFSHRL